MVSSTNVDASCTNVRALALEKPEIAEDSESEDRRDWSNEEGNTNRGPFRMCVCQCMSASLFFFYFVLFYSIERKGGFWMRYGFFKSFYRQISACGRCSFQFYFLILIDVSTQTTELIKIWDWNKTFKNSGIGY